MASARTFTLSYPLRLRPNGRLALVEQGSDEHNAELLSVLVLTRPGERELAPAFGIEDPAFSQVSLGDVVAGVAMFGPPVRIEGLEVRFPDDHTEEVDINFA